MHPTALLNCQHFFEVYGKNFESKNTPRVIEIGSQDVNGSLRSVTPSHFEYIGVDFVEAKGVDIVLTDPYALPFPDNSADIILSSSCLEHSEMFWLAFLEMMRVLKPSGLLYINVPSNGDFHRFPVDCWRFYPDSGRALVTWAHRNNINAALLESYTSAQIDDIWNDFIAIFIKDQGNSHLFPERIADKKQDIYNISMHGIESIKKYQATPEDRQKIKLIGQIALSSHRRT